MLTALRFDDMVFCFKSPHSAPHWVPKSVTNISFTKLVLLDALQLVTGATGLWSQGVTAVVHGCSIHALGPSWVKLHSAHFAGLLRCAVDLSTLQSTPAEKRQMSSFQCNLY